MENNNKQENIVRKFLFHPNNVYHVAYELENMNNDNCLIKIDICFEIIETVEEEKENNEIIYEDKNIAI